MTRKQPPCTHLQVFFSQYRPITRGLLSLERTHCNSVQGTIESNSADKGFSTTIDQTHLCLGSLFYNYDVSALRNCQVVSVLLPDAPQAFYLANGMYHKISRTATLQIKDDSQTHGLSISSIQCQACVMRPSCNSIISFNQGDLVLHPDMDFCETQPEPFLASIELTPSLQNVFSHVPDIGATEFQAYSTGEARQSVLGSLRMELAELPDVKHMSQTTLDELTKPIAEYYWSITPASSAALQTYLPTRTAVLLSTLSITMSLLTFSLSFSLFRRQWQRLFIYAPAKVLTWNFRTVYTHRRMKPGRL